MTRRSDTPDMSGGGALRDDVVVLANLVGRLAFLVQHGIGKGHAREIQREADTIRDRLNADLAAVMHASHKQGSLS